MKLLRSYLFQAVLFLFAVTLMQSCSCSGDSLSAKIDRYVSDEVDFVMAYNIGRALEASEIKIKNGQPQLPEYITEMLDDISPRLLSVYDTGAESLKGIDYTNVLVAGRTTANGNSILVCFNVTSAKELYNSIEDIMPGIDMTEKDGKELIGTNEFSLVVDGRSAVVVVKNNMPLGGSKAIREIEKWEERASGTPLAAWKRDYITEDAILSGWMNSSVIEKNSPAEWENLESKINKLPGVKAKNLSVAGRIDIDGGALRADLTLFNGTEVMKSPVAGTIDAGMLKYVKDTDVAVFACGLNNLALLMLGTIADERTGERIEYYQNTIDENSDYGSMEYFTESLEREKVVKKRINTIMSSVEGSALVALGVRNDAALKDLRRNPATSCDFTAVAKMKSGKGKGCLNVILDEIADSGLSVNKNGDYWVVEQESSDFKLYLRLDGDYIVLSSAKISTDGKNNFSGSIFNDAWLAGEINIPADMPLLSDFDLPCGINIKGSVVAMSGSLEVTFPGSKEKFIPTFVKVIRSIAGI